VKYILTPKGFAEKSRLTYEFIQYSFHFYKRAIRDIEDLLNDFQKGGVKKVVFYGANDLAEIAFISLRGTDIQLIGVADEEKQGKDFLGFTVKSITELKKAGFDRIIVTTIDSKEAQLDKLLGKKIPREKIVMLG